MNIIINLAYLISISFFILGLKFLSSPKTARKGNLFAMAAMFIAVVVTLFDKQIIDYTYIIAGIVIGGVIGVYAARKVQMTAMPQMVAIFNAFGGGASAFVVLSQFFQDPSSQAVASTAVTTVASLFIGMLTFTGSIVAFGKLQGFVRGAPIVFPLQKTVNFLIHVIILILAVAYLWPVSVQGVLLLLAIFILASIVGILLVIPIGGADMPVVIALLNSYSGIAAAATGFVINNYVLIVSGTLVGASGLILTNLMCKAMNRSLTNVLFGAIGQDEDVTATAKKPVTRYTPMDAAMILENAQSVIIVPGYGLAVAQAQYALQDTVNLLKKQDTKVLYAIHPVAGRMPGHMNVLLAEANVPYDLLKDMDEINEEFQNTDVVLVVGANDVINPAAREKGNALSGMPILNVDQADSIIIIKRSLSSGFAGVDNELFYDPKTMMVFGDAKEMLLKIVGDLKKD